MDELSEKEEMELERNLHQLRHTRQQVEKRAKHATVQAKYRAKLALNRAPTRMDFAIVTLGVVLRAIEKNSEHGFVRLLREAIEQELVAADFDQEQVRIRLGRMVEDCSQDLDEWRRSRAWLRTHKARLGQGDGGLTTIAVMRPQGRPQRPPFLLGLSLVDAGNPSSTRGRA